MEKKIFVCDDDPLILNLMIDMLSAKGYQVEVFIDYLALLERLQQTKPSLIILDLQMPELWGDELARIIKSKRETKNIPVVIYSSSPLGEAKARDAGVEAFLPKDKIYTELEVVVKNNLV